MGQFRFLVLPILLALCRFFPVDAQASPTTSTTGQPLYGYEWGLLGPYPQQSYRSFWLSGPLTYFVQRDPNCGTGYIFMSPRGSKVSSPGPMIIDSEGELVWREARYGQATDFKVQQYRGQSYLTFWTGTDTGTFGNGSYVMLDSSYQLYKRVTPVGQVGGDLHEFKITPNGTALMSVYEPTPADLSAHGIAGQGWIYDSIFQEVDIDTGDLIFEWRASEHFDISDTFHTIQAEERRNDASGKPLKNIGRTRDKGWDFFHINSIDKDRTTGNYYISSRYLHTVACIAPNGDVLWNLGGKKNSFEDMSEGAATNFSFQHHATMHEDNILSIFDNGEYDHWSKNAEYSRGMVVSLDLDRMTATLVQDYIHPDHRLLASQGSMQMLTESSHVLVGWGHAPAYTEFDNNGTVLCDVQLVPSMFWNTGWIKNYRIFRSSSWVGNPSTIPDIYLRPKDGRVHVSWNGATEVDTWVLQGREKVSEEAFANLSSMKKQRFEESLAITKDMPTYLRIVAVDRDGGVLSQTEVVDRRVGNVRSELRPSVVKALWIGGAIALVIVAVCLAWCLWRTRKPISSAVVVAASVLVRQLCRRYHSGRTTKPSLEETDATKPLRDDFDDEEAPDGRPGSEEHELYTVGERTIHVDSASYMLDQTDELEPLRSKEGFP